MAKCVKKYEPVILFTDDDRAFLADFERNSVERVKRVTRTRESAMQELIDADRYIRSGKLRKQFKSVA